MNPVGSRESAPPFSPEEIEAMHQNQSTEVVVNKVAQRAGYSGEALEFHGRDKTFKELRAEFKEKEGVAYAKEQAFGKAKFKTGETVLEKGAEHFISERAGRLTKGGGIAFTAAVLMVKGLIRRDEKNQEGKAMAKALARDEMVNGLTLKLDLPLGFKQVQCAERDYSTRSSASLGQKMTTELNTRDKASLSVLQLHCDEGMHAARDMFAMGKTKEALFTQNPSIRARYESDAAYHLGFDALVWAKKDPNAYAETIGALKQRDARYEANHIAVKG